MLRFALIAPALIALAALAGPASPAAAQTWDRYDQDYAYEGRYGGGVGYAGYDGHRYGRRDWNAAPSAFDWRSQLDRPGDYRCDAFWDAGRDDCGARWRDQRRRVSPQARSDYRALAGYRHDDGYGYEGRYRYGPEYGYGRRRGYGSAWAHGYGHGSGGTAYEGAYGRPDIVFPGGGHRYGGGAYGGGRDPGRIDWCRARYRSYDSVSGYYRAYSGRLIWCG